MPPEIPQQRAASFIRRHPLWMAFIALLVISLVALVVIASRSMDRLETRIQDVFDGPKWSIPARVYARPLEIYQGLNISQQDVIDELNRLGYRQRTINGPGQYNAVADRLGLQTRGFNFADGPEPGTNAIVRWTNNSISEVLDSKGNDLPLVRLEPLLIGRISPAQSEDRLLISLDQLPGGLIDALLAVEDPKFYAHSGISFRGILRAIWVNIKERRFAQGGSTLTQQLVKNLFLTRERSIKRKLTEWPMAVILDRRYEKDEILQAFANEVFFAQDRSRAIHGFGLASYYFFDKPVQELQTHEYALLVGLLKGPSYYNPLTHPDRATTRRNLVLRIMRGANLIEEQDLAQWQAMPLGLSRASNVTQQPAYLDLVQEQLTRDYSTEDLHKNGLGIFTNFDPRVQIALEQSLHEALGQIERENALTQEQLQQLEAAAVISSADTGEVVAVLGGREARYAGFNRALDAKRQIGSLLKPFIYLTALEQPAFYNLATPVEDSPIFLEQPDGSIWAPSNYSGNSHGAVPLINALTRSYNLAAVNTGLNVGIENVIDTLERMQLNAELRELPSLLLGAVDLTVADVASLYQTLAAGGFNTPLRAIREIQALDGELLQRYPLRGTQKIDPADMHILNYALQNVMRAGTGRRAYRYVNPDIALAGKSGTSNDQRDSWFAGYGGDYSGVVWMGNDDNTPTEITGSRGALEVWARTFAKINSNSLRFSAPDTVRYVPINAITGNRIDETCAQATYLPFHRDYLPEIAPKGLFASRCE